MYLTSSNVNFCGIEEGTIGRTILLRNLSSFEDLALYTWFVLQAFACTGLRVRSREGGELEGLCVLGGGAKVGMQS